MLSIFLDIFSNLLANLDVLSALVVAPIILSAHDVSLTALLVKFVNKDQRSNMSRIHDTGSFSIDSFLPCSSRYLYANICLPSFVHSNCAISIVLSNGFVIHLATADAFAKADTGILASASIVLGRLVGVATCFPFTSVFVFMSAPRSSSQKFLFFCFQ